MKRLLLVALAVLMVIGGALLARGPVVGTAASTPATAAVKMHIEIDQGRTDEVAHTILIAMHNDGPEKITVTRVEVQSPSFNGAGPLAIDAPLQPGGLRVDAVIKYGTGICTGDDLKPHAAASHVVLRVRTEDGKTQDVRLAVSAGDMILDRVLAVDCQQAFLDRQAVLAFGPWTTQPDGSVTGTVIMQRTGAKGKVALKEFEGSIILRVAPIPETLPQPFAVLQPGQDRLEVPVRIDGDRCTPHVLGEIKKPYVFPAFLVLDDGDPLYSELPITDAVKAAVKPALDACAHRAPTDPTNQH